MKSQNEQILNYLKEGKKITPLEALQMFGCLRLGARIWDLRKQGYPVKSRIVRVGKDKKVAEYFMG